MTENSSYTVGLIILLLGLLLVLWSRLVLGKNWAMPMTKKTNSQLVTSGPYRFIRHPVYTGILVIILGSALTVSYYWFILLAVMAVFFFYSARYEEKFMIQRFPKTYPDYQKETKMFVPFVF
jgi:protein-S-isoprenylcysteine O-methyltransferase Ste14